MIYDENLENIENCISYVLGKLIDGVRCVEEDYFYTHTWAGRMDMDVIIYLRQAVLN